LSHQRQGRESGDHEPRDRRQQRGVAEAQLEGAALGRQDAGACHRRGDHGAHPEDLVGAVAACEGHQRHQYLAGGGDQQDPPESENGRPDLGQHAFTCRRRLGLRAGLYAGAGARAMASLSRMRKPFQAGGKPRPPI
jgi:hypothetical protein